MCVTAILGELHLGHWDTPKGKIDLISEQVSHHPPITAYSMENEQAGIELQGNCAQKVSFPLSNLLQSAKRGTQTSFSGKSINVKQVGHALLTVKLSDGSSEKYLITLPRLRIEGLWFGAPYIELAETSYIQSSSGYHAQIAYSGKGWVSGKSA